MKISEYSYNLTQKNIAIFPPKKRGTSKLLLLNRNNNELEDAIYSDIPKYIEKGDVIVLNETKVERRRTYFKSNRGKEVEVLFLNRTEDGRWYCLIKGARYIKPTEILSSVENKEITIEITERKGDGFLIKPVNIEAEEIFKQIGHTPIPPYMKRDDTEQDYERYNTVFAKLEGSVAAPTASLNLTAEILKSIEAKGARKAYIELQVGWGTFSPIREENIEDHKIHKEKISIPKETVEIVNSAKKNGKKVWAFGTTVARTLESVADDNGFISEYSGESNLYIYPGYKWKCVDHLITNFHIPDSTLILLVSSFAGKNLIHKAYNHALENNYKFLSYGDSMLII